jgi:hypothetical protein
MHIGRHNSWPDEDDDDEGAVVTEIVKGTIYV